MLANGGELEGVRLLSAQRVRNFRSPRPKTDQLDIVLETVVSANRWLSAPQL